MSSVAGKKGKSRKRVLEEVTDDFGKNVVAAVVNQRLR